MDETSYGIIKKLVPNFPVRELFNIPHRDGILTLGWPAFGPNRHNKNLAHMAETYSHPLTGEPIFFREPRTSESISAAAYGFGNNGEVDAKRDIFDPRWLQAGHIVRTQEGIFTNTKVTDEKSLKEMLNGAKKVNGIYLLDKEMAFAPYESFERGVQDCSTFAEGGLARALEHTSEKVAENLRQIASRKFYKRGVNVIGFDKFKEPVLRVAGLGSLRGIAGGRLGVGGDLWYDDYLGYAFGVLKKGAEGTAPKNR